MVQKLLIENYASAFDYLTKKFWNSPESKPPGHPIQIQGTDERRNQIGNREAKNEVVEDRSEKKNFAHELCFLNTFCRCYSCCTECMSKVSI